MRLSLFRTRRVYYSLVNRVRLFLQRPGQPDRKGRKLPVRMVSRRLWDGFAGWEIS